MEQILYGHTGILLTICIQLYIQIQLSWVYPMGYIHIISLFINVYIVVQIQSILWYSFVTIRDAPLNCNGIVNYFIAICQGDHSITKSLLCLL